MAELAGIGWDGDLDACVRDDQAISILIVVDSSVWKHAAAIERRLRAFEVRAILDDRRAVAAARHFRTLRSSGITMRETVHHLVATFCATDGHTLWHDDRDFDFMTVPLGLRLS